MSVWGRIILLHFFIIVNPHRRNSSTPAGVLTSIDSKEKQHPPLGKDLLTPPLLIREILIILQQTVSSTPPLSRRGGWGVRSPPDRVYLR